METLSSLFVVSKPWTDLLNFGTLLKLWHEGDLEIASNNCPIFLVANPIVYETVVYSQFSSYLERHIRRTRHQNGNGQTHWNESIHL